MANTTGTIKRLTDKGFGFIATSDGTEGSVALPGDVCLLKKRDVNKESCARSNNPPS